MEPIETAKDYINKEDHSSLSSKLFRENTLEIYLDYVRPDTKVLDIGCGSGGIAIPFGLMGCDVDAVDNHEGRIKELEENINGLNIETYNVSVFEMKFDKNSYDYVTSRQFMSYFKDWEKVLKIKLEHLKPGGLIIYHQHSKENMELCDDIALSMENKNLVGKGYNNNKRFGASRIEIEKFCTLNNCELVDLIPVSFFLPRSLLFKTGLNKQDIKKFEEDINQRMNNKDIYDFMKWYESRLMQNMPLHLSPSFISIIKKT